MLRYRNMILGIVLIPFLLVSSLRADYFFAVFFAGSDPGIGDHPWCGDNADGFSYGIWCEAQGTCRSSMVQYTAGVSYYALNCQYISVSSDVNALGNASAIDAFSHAVRDDGVYTYSEDHDCSCDYGCVNTSSGTNPIWC
jgi:hypothetical protein